MCLVFYISPHLQQYHHAVCLFNPSLFKAWLRLAAISNGCGGSNISINLPTPQQVGPVAAVASSNVPRCRYTFLTHLESALRPQSSSVGVGDHQPTAKAHSLFTSNPPRSFPTACTPPDIHARLPCSRSSLSPGRAVGCSRLRQGGVDIQHPLRGVLPHHHRILILSLPTLCCPAYSRHRRHGVLSPSPPVRSRNWLLCRLAFICTIARVGSSLRFRGNHVSSGFPAALRYPRLRLRSLEHHPETSARHLSPSYSIRDCR